MIWDHEYPAGYLAILAAILLAMSVNAAALTVRDLGAVDLHSHPVTGLALAMAVIGAGGALAALYPRWRMTAFRGLAIATLGAGLLAALARGDVVPRQGVPWTLHLGFVGMVAAAICLHGAWLTLYCLVMLGSQSTLTQPSVSSISLLLVVAIGVTSLAILKRQILLLTSATQQANRRAEAAALERTRALAAQAAREQWNSWVHDHLLVVFRLGAQRSAAAAELAKELLATGLSRPDAELSDLRRSAMEVAAGQGVRVRWDVITEGEPPVQVTQAVECAMGEAIRNAARHSGVSMVSVSGELTASSAHVTITDAGSGFDAIATASNKLGIRTSIVAKLEAVGGGAEVLSEPGTGTQVRLRWQLSENPKPTLDVPLGWAVLAASGMSALAATRALLSLGSTYSAWVLSGFTLVIVITLVISVWPRVTVVALSVWLASATALAISAPPVGDLESGNWLAVGCAAVFIASARVRRERAGLGFALATFIANIAFCTWLRPGDLPLGWAYWAQPVIYAGLAWLGIAQFERLLRGYRDASQAAIAIEEAVITARAERDERQLRLAGMPTQVIPMLEELSTARVLGAELARRSARVEAATRDYLTAPRLLNRELAQQLDLARETGAYVVLSDGGPHSEPAQLGAVRDAISRLIRLVQPGSRLTVRWTVDDAECFATATVTMPRSQAVPVVSEPGRTEVLADVDALQVRFLTSAGSVLRTARASGGPQGAT